MSHAIFLAHIRSMQRQLDGIVQRNLTHAQVRQYFLTRELTHLSLKQQFQSSTLEESSVQTEPPEAPPVIASHNSDELAEHTVRVPTVEEYLEQADTYLQQGLESAAIGSFVRAIVVLSTNSDSLSTSQSEQLRHALLSLHTLNEPIAVVVVNRLANLKPTARKLIPTINAKI